MQLTAVYQKVAEGYIAFVEELPGANTQGATLEETRANLKGSDGPGSGVQPRSGRRDSAGKRLHPRNLHARRPVKRRELVRHLKAHSCEFLREGGNHSVYVNTTARKVSTVPGHREINDHIARKICRDLRVPEP